MANTFNLRSSLNRSGLKQSNPALYEVINGLLSAQESIIGESQEWSPIPTNLAVGNGTIRGRTIRIGNLVFATIQFIFGSTTVIGGNIRINLPFPPNSESYTINGANPLLSFGILQSRDVSANQFFLGGFDLAENNARPYSLLTAGGPLTATINATTPFTWATGDVLSGTIIYEANPEQ